MAAARAWGLASASNDKLGTPVWLTPQQPYVDGANIYVANETPTTPSYTPTADLPYGSIGMTRLATPAWWISLREVPVPAGSWTLVECHVADAERYTLGIDFSATPSAAGSNGAKPQLSRNDLRPTQGRISALFEPSTLAKRSIQIAGFGRTPGTWYFGGCEVTPVKP